MTQDEHRRYRAGQMAAHCDWSRGMSLKGMRQVPQESDHKYWVKGYLLMLARIELQNPLITP
jgi:hypothetical protein